jgi:iron complex transport system substrate-binding protein
VEHGDEGAPGLVVQAGAEINASADAIRTDPVLSRTPAAQAGHLVILDDKTTSDAFSSGSVPGTAAALDRAVPQFAGALSR